MEVVNIVKMMGDILWEADLGKAGKFEKAYGMFFMYLQILFGVREAKDGSLLSFWEGHCHLQEYVKELL